MVTFESDILRNTVSGIVWDITEYSCKASNCMQYATVKLEFTTQMEKKSNRTALILGCLCN